MLGPALGIGASALRRNSRPWWSAPTRQLDGKAASVVADLSRNRYHGPTGDGPITDLLTFSSGSKWVIGPAGTLDTVAANQPAWDYSGGRRRLLVEAKATTKYGPYSEAMGTGGWTPSGCSWGAAAGGLTPLVEGVTTTQHYARAVSGLGVAAAAGEYWAETFVVARVVGSRNVSVGFIGGSAFTSSTYLTIDLSNGSILGTAPAIGYSRVVPLPDGSWLVTITATTTAAGAVTPAVVLVDGSNQVYLGDGASSVAFGRVNTEKVSAATEPPSSYVPVPGTTAVSRIADDVRLSAAALALLNGVSSTLCLRGRLASAPVGIAPLVGDTSVRRLVHAVGNTQVETYYGDVEAVATAGSDALSTGFGACVARTVGGNSKIALNGGAVASLTTDPAESLSTARIFAGTGDPPVNGWIDEIVVWPFVGSDAGLQSQARKWS